MMENENRDTAGHPALKPDPEFLRQHRFRLQELAGGQAPVALFIGCSDSRVTPEMLFGLDPGQWFMLRNVGNIVPPYWKTEIGIASVLEYAVQILEVEQIIVCGHTDCGAMQGLVQGVTLSQHPALARWLDVARPALATVDAHPSDYSGDEHHHALVTENVRLQLGHLESYPYIREAVAAGRLALRGCVYNLGMQAVEIVAG